MRKILLADVKEPSLQNILSQQGFSVEPCTLAALPEQTRNAVLIFLSAESASYRQTLRQIRRGTGAPPVIVFTRNPQTADWLDALEAGAVDYCTAPFEARKIRWMVDLALSTPKAYAV